MRNITNESGEFLFRDLANFALCVLSLPHSNAECERVFSSINLIKTKTRNRLITDTINALLLAKQLVKFQGNCTNFKPTTDMCRKFCSNILYCEISKDVEENNEDVIFEEMYS